MQPPEEKWAALLPLFTGLPRRGVLGNRASGVRNSRKPNLYHYSFLQTLYIGVILCAADWGYARMHEQLSGVRGSRKPDSPGPIELAPYVTDRGYRSIAASGAYWKLGFRLTQFSETQR